MNPVERITKGEGEKIKVVLERFGNIFVGLTANVKSEGVVEQLISDYAKLQHTIAVALGGKAPAGMTDEEEIEFTRQEFKELIENQRQLISLAKKRDSAQNN